MDGVLIIFVLGAISYSSSFPNAEPQPLDTLNINVNLGKENNVEEYYESGVKGRLKQVKANFKRTRATYPRATYDHFYDQDQRKAYTLPITPTAPIPKDDLVLEGDMVLNKQQLEELKAALITGTLDGMTVSQNPSDVDLGISGRRNVQINRKGRWPNNIVYFSFHQNVPESRRNTVRNSLSDLESELSGCLKFKEKDHGKRVVVWRDNIEPKSCKTNVGYQYQSSRTHWLWLADWCSKGNIQHEFLHAAGIWHTQMRWDRDEYVTIMDDNIKKGNLHNFNKYSKNYITHYGLPYDYASIMHYSKWAFSVGKVTIVTKDPSKQNVIGQRKGVSKGDIQLVQHMYGCLKGCKTTGGPRLAKCIFPFKYKDVSYNGCTKIDARSYWCATTMKDNGDMMTKNDWGYCEHLCPLHRDCKTTNNLRCVFPFIYQGERYNSCTSKKSSMEWCATKVKPNAQYIPKHWGRCGSYCP